MLAAALVSLLAPAAVPEAKGVVVQWRGPAGCGDGAAAQSMVDELVGGARPDLDARAIVIVEGGDDAWHATIEIDVGDTHSVRDVRGSPCKAVADAVGLVVAVAVDPLATSVSVAEVMDGRVAAATADAPTITPDDTAPDDTAPDDTAPDDTAPDNSLDTAPRRDRADGQPRDSPVRAESRRPSRASPPRAVSAFVAGGGAVGLLDPIGGQLGAGLALGLGQLRLELAGSHRFASAVTHPDQDGAGADVSISAGRASICWAFGAGRLSVPVCGGLELGGAVAQGFGLQNTVRTAAAWAAVTPHVRPTIALTPWFRLGLDVQAPLSLVRPRFSIDDLDGDILQIGPAGVRFGLALEFTFFDERGSTRARG